MATGSITIRAQVDGLPSGKKEIGPLSISMTAANGNTIDVALASGANTITVPTAGATPTSAIVIPNTTSTATLTLKGISGDTGVILSKTHPFVVSFDATPQATFVITASATTTAEIVWI